MSNIDKELNKKTKNKESFIYCDGINLQVVGDTFELLEMYGYITTQIYKLKGVDADDISLIQKVSNPLIKDEEKHKLLEKRIMSALDKLEKKLSEKEENK